MKTTIALALAGLLLAAAPPARAADASFDLKLPCKVLSYDPVKDGGSWDGQLIGADGTLLDFSWDGATRAVASDAEAGPRPVYLGAKHWTDKGAEPLAVGSRAEDRFIEALQGWVDTVIPVDDQAGIYAPVLGPNGLDQAAWKQAVEGRSAEEIRALRVARLVRFLEDQRKAYSDR